MKKLLILAYDFPPYVSVGGLRPYSWFKYLQEYGVNPIVVTRQWSNKHGNHLDYIASGVSDETILETFDNGTIIRTPYTPNLANRLMLKYGESKYKLLRKSITAFYEFAQWIWKIGPKSQLYFGAKEYLKTNKVDAIIATGDPYILFRYAAKLSYEYSVPWIADYRDPWSVDKKICSNAFLKAWNTYFERKTIKTASLITTVSEFFKIQISSVIGEKKFSILTNGFDHELLNNISSIKQKDDILRIAFVGTIYPWHPMESFMNVISKFVIDYKDKKLEVNLYGINNSEFIEDDIEKKFPALKSVFNIFPKLPNEVLLSKLAENNVMLLFNYYSYIGTKIFDYLGIKRFILLCFSDDPVANRLKQKYYNLDELKEGNKHVQEDVIIETNSGMVIKDSEHLYNELLALSKEFEDNKQIRCDSVNVEQYSRKKQVEKLAEIVKGFE